MLDVNKGKALENGLTMQVLPLNLDLKNVSMVKKIDKIVDRDGNEQKDVLIWVQFFATSFYMDVADITKKSWPKGKTAYAKEEVDESTEAATAMLAAFGIS